MWADVVFLEDKDGVPLLDSVARHGPVTSLKTLAAQCFIEKYNIKVEYY